MNSLVISSQVSPNQKLATLQSKSTATVLTRQEVESLRLDLKNSIKIGHQVTFDRKKKFDI
jgi:hypothetical protein